MRGQQSAVKQGVDEAAQRMQKAGQKSSLLSGRPKGAMSEGQQKVAQATQQMSEQRGASQAASSLGDAAGCLNRAPASVARDRDRAAQLAKEARQLADALEGGRIDGTTLARQQQLFRRLLDAGRSLEKDEREDSNKHEAKSAKGDEQFTPTNTDATAKNASKFREPNWNELRGLTADERRAILDYFKRINEQKP